MIEIEAKRPSNPKQIEADRLRALHDHAVSQSQLHRKKILPADSSRDSSFVMVGGIVFGLASVYLMHVLRIHNDFFRLFIGLFGLLAGAVLGGLLYGRLFVKDESSQPPVMDRSWGEYRKERHRWMWGGKAGS